MNVLETYLTDLAAIRGTGANVPETSFYPALATLLDSIGEQLTPRVTCIMHLSDTGAGIPDGGLFSEDQIQRGRHGRGSVPPGNTGQLPSRGVIEAKPPAADLQLVASSPQVGKYWNHYRMVLVTNFRAFILIGRDANGNPAMLESFTLASTEAGFWTATAHPRKTAGELGARFEEYLRRVLLHNAPLAAPQEVARLLASYAHDARLRIEIGGLPALARLREALQESLGLTFDGERGEHFFRSTLVQTLFYGLFSAWVLWARHQERTSPPIDFGSAIRAPKSPYATDGIFDWRSAHHLLRVPMLRALFVQIADPNHLGPLGLIEVLDWTATALNRVERAQFFATFDEGHAVQYFYEPFLHAFDPVLRKDLGVWYTPEEIVRYQVERVDAVLRSELGVPDGLADPSVVVLDPCCGTGTYLRAVLQRIAATLRERGGDALMGNDLKRAAMERVFGFEIMPAPFVIAHLQIGLELEHLGAPLLDGPDTTERVGVYLTNALTGWEPPKDKPPLIAFPGFEEERDAASRVKRKKPILVVIGNPPYNAFSGVSPREEDGLVEPYKKGLSTEWGIKKYNLDDLYVRFFRLAEKRIAEHTGRGVVSYISNFSYLGDPSFVVARRQYLDEFDSIWIDCLNGDSRETGKLTPDGRPDPSVFSTEWNREGIRVGTAVCLLVRTSGGAGDAAVRFRHFWGARKRAELLESLTTPGFIAQYTVAHPAKKNRWSFRPSDVSDQYMKWPKVTELSAFTPYNGPVERRGMALISIQRDTLFNRMQAYFDQTTSNSDVARIHPSLMMTGNRIIGPDARKKLLAQYSFDPSVIVPYPFKPMDVRWCYLDNIRPLFSEPSPELLRQRRKDNKFFVTRDTADKSLEGTPFFFSNHVCDYDFISGHARHFPVFVQHSSVRSLNRSFDQFTMIHQLEIEPEKIHVNYSYGVRLYLSSLHLPDPDSDQATAELIWYHALAIGYSPAYLGENADGLRQDWPRIPLPAGRKVLPASAALGRRVAALLDTETAVDGVTAGTLPPKLRSIGVFRRRDGRQADAAAGDLDLTAGWGHAGKDGVTMPGKGRMLVRSDGALDILLNDSTAWENIPEAVWRFTIGGYQVIKKWLSYREKPLLGRGLTPEEVRHVTDMARRIAALVDLQTELDGNYRKVVKETWEWGGDEVSRKERSNDTNSRNI